MFIAFQQIVDACLRNRHGRVLRRPGASDSRHQRSPKHTGGTRKSQPVRARLASWKNGAANQSGAKSRASARRG
jgi:hypothetical protein